MSKNLIHMRFRMLSICVLLLIMPVACSQNSPSSGSSGACQANVSGTVTLGDGIELPGGVVMTVQIRDTSRQDVAATVIGEQTIAAPGRAPVPYEVCYSPEEIDERFSYSMSARITDRKNTLLFINDTNIPVITRGNPTSGVEIRLIHRALSPASTY